MHILLLVRHYPPEVSGGARRPYLLTKALRKRGVRVTVAAPFDQPDDEDHLCVPHPVYGTAPPDFEAQDEARRRRKTPIRDFLRLWLLWPDPDIRWCRRAAEAILASGLKPDWLMTTSPPESAHVVGAKIARRLNIPWLAEFRDTWIENPHRKILETSPLRAAAERVVARRTLSRVTALTAASTYMLDEVRRYAPADTPALHLEHFSAKPERIRELPAADVNLVHTGGFTLSDRRRPIEPLLDIVARSAKTRHNLHLHLAGRLSPREREAAAAARGFRVTLYGELPLEDSQALQAGSDALILYTPPESPTLPGKYAEYRFARRPILYMGGGEWLDLVDDRTALAPLETALPTLQKGQSTGEGPPFSADDAAAKVVSFLSAQQA